MSRNKKIDKNARTGQKGVNHIERVVLDMDCVWHPAGPFDAGIDGHIEVIDPQTGDATNCIVQVQSKATLGPLGGPNAREFTYLCEEADLRYWLSGTANVVLIRTNPQTGECYWASIKDRFATPEARNARKIVFDKDRDRFDVHARDAIVALAISNDSGLYLSPIPRRETLESNLLEVVGFPATYFVADTKFPNRKSALGRLLESHKHIPGAWTIKGRTVYSLHDLREKPWQEICDLGSVEELPLEEWAQEEDEDRIRDFVQILNYALSDILRSSGVALDPEKHLFYFLAPRVMGERKVRYRSRSKMATRTVFKGYQAKSGPARVAYYRHVAMRASFLRIEDRWFLEINPSYRFSSDGKRLHPKHADLLSTIQRIDGSLAVANQIVMWASYLADLSRGDLFENKSSLKFGSLATFELDAGIDDGSWLKSEEDQEKLVSDADEHQLSLEICL